MSRLHWLLVSGLAMGLAMGCSDPVADDDDGDAGAGAQGGQGGVGEGGAGGGAGGAGGVGGVGGGVGGAGGQGGAVGGEGGEGGGAGGQGGAVDPMDCDAACARVADCSAGEDWCPDLNADDSDDIIAGCLTTCTGDVAGLINGSASCDDFMVLLISFSPEFAENCGQPPPEGLDQNCLDVYDATCAKYGSCNVLVDDGQGNMVAFGDVCEGGRGAIVNGLIPCGGENDDYTDDGAVAGCVAAIGAAACGDICSGEPVGPPAACDGVLVAEASSFECD
ncbi:MAG: hypothetical protein ACI9U2_004843 [Bradymonadia bacterium]|jgi:hypothetical protein